MPKERLSSAWVYSKIRTCVRPTPLPFGPWSRPEGVESEGHLAQRCPVDFWGFVFVVVVVDVGLVFWLHTPHSHFFSTIYLLPVSAIWTLSLCVPLPGESAQWRVAFLNVILHQDTSSNNHNMEVTGNHINISTNPNLNGSRT